MRTPYIAGETHFEGTVLESKELLLNLLFETRLQFTNVSADAKFVLDKIVSYFKEGK